jgi:hypothetical protein
MQRVQAGLVGGTACNRHYGMQQALRACMQYVWAPTAKDAGAAGIMQLWGMWAASSHSKALWGCWHLAAVGDVGKQHPQQRT